MERQNMRRCGAHAGGGRLWVNAALLSALLPFSATAQDCQVPASQPNDMMQMAWCPEYPPTFPEDPPPPPTNVIGHVDGVAGGHIQGWACSTGINASIDVHLYVGGAAGTPAGVGVGAYHAGHGSEAAVAAACQASGSAYRFQIPITSQLVTQHAGKTIHVHGISPAGGPNNQISGSGVHRIPLNQAPSVTLTAPAPATVVGDGSSVVLRANASDPDDGVASVTFYAGGQALGTVHSAPYEMTWSGVSSGVHQVNAKASDTRGAVANSATSAVKVSRITGEVSSVTGETITGWACSTFVDSPIDVHLYLGGPAGSGIGVSSARADHASEAAVAAACQAGGTAYRFQIPVTQALLTEHGGKKVYVHGISPVGGFNHFVANSGTYQLPVNPPWTPPLIPPTGGVRRKFVYDQHQQLCKVIEPETGATVMDYDGAGNLQWSAAGLNLLSDTNCDTIAGRDSGRKVTRYYDNRNRLHQLLFPDGRGDQVWLYTADGLPRHIETYNATSGGEKVVNLYDYNRRRMLAAESITQPGWYTWGIGYGYDANGNLATHTYPTGLVIGYAPNALGQPTRVHDQFGHTYASGLSYYPNGAIKQFTYGNGLAHSMAQNARQLPTRVTDGGAALDYDYGYDANGNISHIYDYIPDLTPGSTPKHRWMTYDGLDRLTAVGSAIFGGDHWHRFTYDQLDNIKSWKLAGVKDYANYYYESGTNRLTNIINSAGSSIIGLGYDAQGNLANKNGVQYEFDYGNRLRQVVGKESYRYDGHGRRVLNARTSAITVSQYSNAGQVMYQEETGKGNFEHIYLAGSLLATRNSGLVKYQHTDALGSPVAVTNAAGQVIERNDYEPYGAVIGQANYSGIGFTGHVQDAATGLTYMQQRYYDPTCGCFLSVDPVTALDSRDMRHFNRYAYAYNNPYKFTDPDGRCPWCIGAGIGIGLEIARQVVTGEIKDTSLKGIAGNLGKAVVAGAAGATGAGIGAGVAKLTASVAVRAAANTVAGAAIGAASTGANNVIDGKNVTDGMGKGALVGGALGAAGSLAGDAADALKSAANAKYVDAIPLAERNLLEHMKGADPGGGANPSAVGAGAAVSNTVSNSGGLAESCGAQKRC